ncbi:MAG: hypothetical protein QNJ29_02050 [Rhizobiaceae bacterium]|nr:hypothetical protein [Rhizobiaceae bacterium]
MLFALMLFLARRVLTRQKTIVKILGALLLFWLFVWCSPQIYYQYYHLLFEGLPYQWVIWPPASPLDALRMLVFQGPQNLSAHSQGILGWCLLIVPFLQNRKT